MNYLSPSKYFPPAELADPDGLIAFGGSLGPDWLLDAYQHGIFPWPVADEQEDILAWWSPDPRAVIEFGEFHASQRILRTCRSDRFQVTCNQDFLGVLQGCATAQDRAEHTWLLPGMIRAYTHLHELKYAHSVEVWQDGALVGGTYGVAIGGMFAAESKFYLERDASKVALVHLVGHLRARGYELLDIQQLTDHMERFGATEIPRDEYLTRLARAMKASITFGDALEGQA
jgi:leucyl/phenylalanyl-tRNA--protein transferase